MADFLFKNLSVKLLAAEGDELVCIAGDTACDNVNHTCFDRSTCGGPNASACGFCTFCTFQTCGTRTTDQVVIARDAGQLRDELAAHKRRLHAAITEIERQEKALEERSKPRTLEELDALRASLTDAIAELDEQRARLQSEPPQRPE